ncbi:MAG TPA: TAT-variant-translocated molybdopterin oxidoreductase, partial [Pirellulales bacterium]|nr:TAT-variant-translocated molybdopterin oxidoreductase [Pirellulales bacterium]
MSHRKQLTAEWEPLAQMSGRQFWRSLEELSDSPVLRQMIEREFPAQASFWPDSLSRRNFLILMGASLALGGISGCSVKPAPSEELVPYVRQPKDVVPGTPLFYATAMTLDGGATGLLVETHLGRPIKVEGNPDHPASLGATNVFHQASVLSLYDPDRSQAVRELGERRSWDEAIASIRRAMDKMRITGGKGLRLLTERVISPTLQRQLETLLDEFPNARWVCHEALLSDAAHEAARWAFGEVVTPVYDFTKADVVLSLDDDFLLRGPGHLRYAADFMSGRRVRTARTNADQAQMNRLYVAETAVSCAGVKADHRLALRAAEIEPLGRAIAAALGVEGIAAADVEFHSKWVASVSHDLLTNHERSLVLAGERQPAGVHLLAHAMNTRLGNVGQTVHYITPVEARP